jgi:[ribosomal protein S18]-alanine N-acetyltransferase
MIRTAEVGDFLDIARLDRESWGQNRHNDYIPDGEHVWRIWCEHAIVAVDDVESEISGAVLVFPCRDSTYCLHKIFVAPSRRGNGVGMALMAYALRIADEEGFSLFLTVDPHNQKALALYQSAGFTDRRFVSGYYRSNEDRLVLTRLPSRISS